MTPNQQTRHQAQQPTTNAFIGCLLAGALGDALGYPIEFVASSEIDRRLGASTPRALALGAHSVAVVSDDTQMTLFTAEGMIRAVQRFRDRGLCHVPTVIQGAYLRWLSTQTGHAGEQSSVPDRRGWLLDEPRLHVRRAPGNTCLSALEQIRDGASTPTAESPLNDSKGCGAVMRAAPAGLAARDRGHAFELGRDTGVLTHGHPSGYLSAAYLAAVVFDLVHGLPLEHAMDNAGDLLRRSRGHKELAEVIAQARALARLGPPTPKTIERLGSGWVGDEALAIALLCALTADCRSPDGVAEALWRAVFHSGDSDSTGSITGNLLGAIVGVNGLPARWLDQLEMRDVIEKVATDLYRVVVDGVVLDHTVYPPN